ncbi:chromo domain-containing protein [Colletotrichum tofieldiae]|uniref:Chromo domain-containing protein n=1 Tax=Colletotrichum tofieldiae TaxID=708197 RepID=A0A166PSH7_9PEZI|nr:chromo domain-containing protein [Colletotrichum tofieldiae]GKT88544.1 chromo domain-containing protein [Colletotrichum tofieldiae]
MHITYFPRSEYGTSICPKLDVSTTAANAPVAEMNCSEGAYSSTAEPEATAVIWEDVPPVAKEAEDSVPKATAATGAMCGPAPGTAATAVTEDFQTDYFFIQELFGHRLDPTCDTLFEINVRWEGDEETWEPESNLQKDAALTLFAYWRRVKGGRESAMVNRELWHVFKVVSHETKRDGSIYLQVAWVGSPDTSWEPETNIREAAGRLVENYWSSVVGRLGAMARPA